MSTLYELRHIRQRFKDRTVLDIDQLSIVAGKIYALIGPNGAGKTTLLNLLAFLEQASEGELRFGGERVEYRTGRLLALRRRVVLLDQYPILFTGPVWKNVEYGLKIRGVGAEERRQRTLAMLELVGMQSFLEADAHKLSGGETKRVALARALALRPEVLLCDEPGANVDKENQEAILTILARINRSEKTSVIFSTHYLAQGRSLADHTLMLEHGSLTDMVHENVYRAVLARREKDRVIWQLPDNVMVSMPAESFIGDALNCRLQIDPEGVLVVGDGDRLYMENVLSGHIVQVSQDRGRVRVVLDCRIKLTFFLPMQAYLENPPVLGAKMTVWLPDGCLRCNPMG